MRSLSFIALVLFFIACGEEKTTAKPDPHTLLEEGKSEEALKAFDELLKENPDDDTIRFERAQLLYDLGMGSEAQPDLEKVARGSSGFRNNARYLLGNWSMDREEYEKALYHFELLLTDSPTDIWGHLGAGIALRTIKTDSILKEYPSYFNPEGKQYSFRFREALKEFHYCVGFDPKFVPALIELGRFHHTVHNSDSAVLYYKKAIAVSEDNANAFHELAIVYSTIDSLDAAESNFTKAIEIQADPYFYFDRGYFYLEQRKDQAKACADFKLAREKGLPEQVKVPEECE